jgi:hypothetical protein
MCDWNRREETQLTVTGARVVVTFSRAVVELEVVPLVYDEVGVTVRYFPLHNRVLVAQGVSSCMQKKLNKYVQH